MASSPVLPVLPVLPVELWQQILGHVVTPTDPVSINAWCPTKSVEGWTADDLTFSPADIQVKRSFESLTQESADCFFFPVSVPDIWRQLISQATWSLHCGSTTIRDLTCDEWLDRLINKDKVPRAQGLESLQTTFKAQVKHVEVVVDMSNYSSNVSMEERAHRPLPKNQWASAMISHIPSVIETCSSLKSLRLYLDLCQCWESFGTFYRESKAFSAIWQCTSPDIRQDGKDWGSVAGWKADCKRKEVDFKVIARSFIHNPTSYNWEPIEDDLTAFWDLPRHVKEEKEYNWADQLHLAIIQHIENGYATLVWRL